MMLAGAVPPARLAVENRSNGGRIPEREGSHRAWSARMAEGERGTSAAAQLAVPAFVRDLAFGALPADVVAQGQRCLLDLIGVAAAGSRTQGATIATAYAATQLLGRDRNARILFDGRRAGLAGAAFAGAATIDALDAHDGHVLTKGHAGVAILPTLLAVIDGAHPGEPAAAVDGREFITCLVLGYEIATRAGMALHATVRRLPLFRRLECTRLRRGRRAPPRVRSPADPPGAGRRRVLRPARTDPACVRFPDDGEGRLRLGCACRGHRGAARARRIHGRAGAHHRARRCARLLGRSR